MAITDPVKGYSPRASRTEPAGPRLAFLASVAGVSVVIGAGALPAHLLMPLISTLLFVLAMVFALVAWIRCSTDEYGVTYWDVAGALILVGICTSALIEPETLAGLVAAPATEN
jgi:hypothetical protein